MTTLDLEMDPASEHYVLAGEKVSTEVPENKPQPPNLDNIARYITDRFNTMSNARYPKEITWIDCYLNYRGRYSLNQVFRDNERSRAFYSYTAVKVMTAYDSICEVLFGAGKFPITIEPDNDPLTGLPNAVHVEVDPQLQKLDHAPSVGGDATDPSQPKDTSFKGILGVFGEFFSNIMGLKKGAGTSPTSATMSPADDAARVMDKRIQDQLMADQVEADARLTIQDCCLYGSGVFKGPLCEEREIPFWREEDGITSYTPLKSNMPCMDYVNVWNFYQDPDAIKAKDAKDCIERHKWSKTMLAEKADMEGYDADAIDWILQQKPNYDNKFWESIFIVENQSQQQTESYEVLEYWGIIDRETAVRGGFPIPDAMKDQRLLHVVGFVCMNKVIRLELNPFKPMKLPYYVVPYERDPYSPYGTGVAEKMACAQIWINGFARLLVDNAALSNNVMFEINVLQMMPGQDFSAYPGKQFFNNLPAGQKGINTIQVPSQIDNDIKMIQQGMYWADTLTLPASAHGQQGVGQSSANRSASGEAANLSQAQGTIRNVVKNMDDYWLEPMGWRLYWWNLQFISDSRTRLLLKVRAKGTDSLMRKEVLSQRLMQLLQVVQAPTIAPYVKIGHLLRDIFNSLDLDADRLLNSPDEFKVAMTLLQQFGLITPPQQQPGPTAPGANGPGSVPGLSLSDNTGRGGGNPGASQAPAPGTPGFSGSPQKQKAA